MSDLGGIYWGGGGEFVLVVDDFADFNDFDALDNLQIARWPGDFLISVNALRAVGVAV